MDSSASVYIPIDRRWAIAQESKLPDRSCGAALFADISGFTALTEILNRVLGPRHGTEELTRHMNRVYDALIAEIHRYRGSVIGFSGDAVTCWFPGKCFMDAPKRQDESDAQAHAARLAVTCAQSMHQALKHVGALEIPGEGQVNLVMKISVASGPARRFQVGEPQIQLLDVVAGATLSRMATGEHLARRGELLVDEATYNYLQSPVDCLEWRTAEETGERFAVIASAPRAEPQPWPELPANALTAEQIRPWVLPAVFDRLQTGVGEFLTELRPAVSLFLRFSGIDFEAEQAGEKLDRYICWVQQLTKRYDGALIQLTVGEKGSYFYIAFGAPLAHENDAWRAASIALDLLSPPPELSYILPPQIGISRGMMRTGAYGGQQRRTYGVLGDDVNLAARLMQHARPGEILVSHKVQQVLPEAFVWEARPPVKAKGKSTAVEVANLVSSRQRRVEMPLYAPTLVGRQAEMAQLAQFAAPLSAAGFAGVFYLVGEAGVGKSRLVHEFRQRLLSEGLQPGLQWRSLLAEQLQGQALHPFRVFLRSYFQQRPGSAEKENKANFGRVLEELRDSLPPAGDSLRQELDRTRSLLGALVDLHWENSLYEQLEPRRRFENVLSALRALLLAESLRNPLILHVEDAHWLDPDSFELLKGLLQEAAEFPLGVLISARPLDTGQIQLDLPTSVPQLTLPLVELKPEHVHHMARQVLNADPLEGAGAFTLNDLSPEVGHFLAEKTNGNPLFVEQLALDLRERGLLQVQEDEWVFSVHGELEVPSNLTAVLIARLDRLAAQVKVVVQTAAVLGREFDSPVLENMLDHRAWVDAGIKAAEAALIWSLTHVGRYLFRQTLLRDAAYEMQVHSRLQALHTQAAQAIEAVYNTELAAHAAPLAQHYQSAGQLQPAYHWWRVAGERAAAQFATREAIQHYRAALAVLVRLPAEETAVERQGMHAALGELLASTGQYDVAEEHLDQALQLVSALPDPQQRACAAACACRWTARLYEMRANYPDALTWVGRGLAALEAVPSREKAELLLIAGLIHTRQGAYEQAGDECRRALEVADTLNDLSARARAENLIGHMARLHGDFPAALHQFQKSLELYIQTKDLPGQALARNQMGNASVEMGQWSRAHEHYIEARRIFQQIGDAYNQVFVDNNLGFIMLNQGQLPGAQLFFEEALQTLIRMRGSVWVIGALHMNLGAVSVRRGDALTAREHLHTALAKYEQAQARDFLSETYRYLGDAALLQGEIETAGEYARQSLALAQELKMRSEEGKARRQLGEVQRRLGNALEAFAELQMSIDILGELGDDFELARSQHALAAARLTFDVQDAAGEAVRLLEASRQVFERLGAQLDLKALNETLSMLDERPIG